MRATRNGQSGEIIETLSYAPGLQGGTDLEGATKTISNTSENAVADYTSVHTIAAPTDSRIAVLRGCMRLTVTIDSWGGGGVQLNYRVKRGGASVSTGILAVAAATGQKIISWDITTLITGAQTNGLFLWVDAGTCVISEVTMWTAVGTITAWTPALVLTHSGFVSAQSYFIRIGTGTPTFRYLVAGASADLNSNHTSGTSSDSYMLLPLSLVIIGVGLGMSSTVATDLPIVSALRFNIRKEE